jgi:excisionase family DNA binding protein
MEDRTVNTPYAPTISRRQALAADWPEPALLRVEEASRYLALGRTKTYELVAQGEIPSIRFGRSLRIPREALRAWLAAQLRETGTIPPQE